VLTRLRIAAEHQVTFSEEYRIRTGNAPWRWIAHHGQTLHDASGKPCVLAGIVEDITARKQAESDRERLVASLLHAEEAERRRIARELHDTTAQRLAVLKINFALLGDALARVPDDRLVTESRHILDQALFELRSLTYLLHPPLLEDFGLASALGDFATGITQRNGVKVEIRSDDFHGRLPPAIELALFRVAQESVANAIRHSGTKEILIRLARDAFEARIEIQDFGHGFPIHPGVARPTGVGIASMQERLALVGGTFDIESDSHGVCVLASVPVPADSHLST
jgi:signal transduction histidine kinase